MMSRFVFRHTLLTQSSYAFSYIRHKVGGYCVLLLLLIALSACRTAPQYFVPETGVDYSRGLLHQVDKGDTLMDVASFYQRDMYLLARLNEISPDAKLAPGDFLFIPPTNNDAIVKSGELTLAMIREVRQQMRVSGTYAPDDRESPDDEFPDLKGPQKQNIAFLPARIAKNASGPVETEEVVSAPTPSREYGFVWPVSGSYSRGFAKSGWRKYHVGVDIAASQGTPIWAAQSGTVLFSGKLTGASAYGNMVVLDHGNGFSTVYAHCSETLVRANQKVTQGQEVARVGATGNATGNHLHVELRYNGKAVDPEKYFPEIRKRANLVATGQ